MDLLARLPSAFPDVILPAFLLLAVGFFGARRFGGEGVRALSGLVVDFCFPALAFGGIARTVAGSGLVPGLSALAWGTAVFAAAALTGLAVRRFASPGRGATVAFLVAMPNWIFLPLPIAPTLWGPAAAGDVLWINLLMQLAIWSAGIALLTGRGGGAAGWRTALTGPAFLASLAGIVAGLWAGDPAAFSPSAPGAHAAQTVHAANAASGAHAVFGTYAAQTVPGFLVALALRAVDLLAGITIPLSFVVMGAQLAAARLHPRAMGRDVALVAVARLLVAPAFVALAVRAFAHGAGTEVDFSHTAATAVLVAAMPCAISCGSIVERYGGDDELTAQAVVVTTLASLATVPLLLWLAGV